MSTQAAPAIPPRPSRSPNQQGLAPADVPKIPPRPSRRFDRSTSPLRDSYAPSPLNEPPNSSNLSRSASQDVPRRPPSVTIPSLGEEGIEYEDLNVGNVSESHRENQHPAPAETRNVGSELKLHAPRPSLPSSSAKARVQAVTRTDSRQAAAAGLGGTGSPTPDEHPERPARSLHSQANGSRAESSTASIDRRLSMNGDDHGIPEIGQRVPMYPNAGDVQAPSPSPYILEQAGPRTGRNHNRTRSGREASLPPGSYGLHGHGVQHNDKFEKAWYEKHPEEYVKEEQGQYGPGVGSPRPDWALSSDDLNKIVRGSAVTGSGLGTSPAVNGTPEEEIGYIASDEYTHRLSSPPPESRRSSRLLGESSLRKESLPAAEDEAPQEDTTSKDTANKSEEPRVIHVDEPYHHLHHPDGFAQTPDPEAHSHDIEEGGAVEEEPILAADEVRPESAFQHPAISPTLGRRESMEFDQRSRTPSVNPSRSHSRTTSHQNTLPTLARFNSREEREETHTPLEDVEEYEPLFPDDDSAEKNPISTADRFKQRPGLAKHRFPSQDIWEDSPNSLQLHAAVSTPDVPKPEDFETPEQESFRRSEASHVDPHKIASQILEAEDHDDKSVSRPDVAKQRFPSRDIWEDTPESQKLVTTIEPSEEAELKSPDVPTKPSIPIRPQKRAQQGPPVDAATKPVTSPIEKRQPPSIPERPKPQVPTRPSKPIFPGNNVDSKDVAAKPKPAVPARPGGSKIAALKAGFLSDLNSRLQLGPQAPPKPQEKKEEAAPAEKQPLSDARKGRARGPARRKPAAEKVTAKLPTIPEVKITTTWNVWQVGEDGNLVVGDTEQEKVAAPDTAPSESSTMAPPIAKNMAGEPADPQTTPREETSTPSDDSSATETAETQPTFTDVAHTIPSTTEGEGPAVEPTIKRDEPEASSEAVAAQESTSKEVSDLPTESGVDDTAEVAATTADEKRASESV